MSLFVPHKDGAKSVFINDYHFIYRLGVAKMSSSAEVRGHAIVLSDFTDFNGLAEAARADLEKPASVRASARDRFEFADITWGWKGGERELFPVPDGKHCCDFGGKQIAIMMQIAHGSTLDEPPKDLKQDVNFNRAWDLLQSKQRPEGAATAEGSTDPFQFDYSAMPTSLRWKVGKEPKQSFVYPRFEADGENAYHVHLLHEPADGTILKVKNFLLTARKSANHWDSTKRDWQEVPTNQQRDDLPRLWAMLETLKRSGGARREEVPNDTEGSDTEVGDPLVQWTADLNLSRDQLQAFLGEIGVPTEELESWTLSDFSAAFAEELQRVRAPQAKKDPPKKKEPRKKVSKIPQEKK